MSTGCNSLRIELFHCMAALALCLAPAAAAAQIEVASIEDLQKIGNDPAYPLDSDYVLSQDIDASATVGWNSGAGFDPIGGSDTPSMFTGSFDGQGHVITGLVIDRAGEDYVGLFGYIGSGGEVTNLGIEDGDITGGNYAGGLVGYNDAGALASCYATGSVTGSGNAGGLVGYHIGSTVVEGCYATGAVTATSGSAAGGLMGANTGATVTNCYATGDVSGGASTGGLLGASLAGSATSCYATGQVTGSGDYAGGLIGHSHDTTWTDCHATGQVTGAGEQVGGLAGHNQFGALTSCYATGKVTGGEQAGGLVGYSGECVLTNCYAWGNVSGSSDIGGLVGLNFGGLDNISGLVENCYATGAVTGGEHAGGLVGWNENNPMENCYARGGVTGTSGIGGLIGYNQGWVHGGPYPVTNCYATGVVSGDESVGGLVGYDENVTVENCFWDADTSLQAASAAGTGLTTEAMMQAASFTGAGWDFVLIWDIDEGLGYPFLRAPSGEGEGEGNGEGDGEGDGEDEVEGESTPEAESVPDGELTADGEATPEAEPQPDGEPVPDGEPQVDGEATPDGEPQSDGEPVPAEGEEEGEGRETEGLQVLYTFEEGGGTSVLDVSGVGTALDLSIADSEAVTWLEGALSIDAPTIISSPLPATKIVEAVLASNEITLEAWITPASVAQTGPARIVTISSGTSERDVTLGQDLNAYEVRLRTTATSLNGLPPVQTRAETVAVERQHVVFTRDAAGVARIFVDAVQRGAAAIDGDFSNWSAFFALALANEHNQERAWLGEYHLFAVYSRALRPSEVRRNFSAGTVSEGEGDDGESAPGGELEEAEAASEGEPALDGEMPGDGEAPTDGEPASDGEPPVDGESVGDGEGELQPDGEAPDEAEAPPSGEAEPVQPEDGEGLPPWEQEEGELASLASYLLDAFDNADADGDAALSLDEAQDAIPQLTQAEFELLDNNDDGVLTEDELLQTAEPEDGEPEAPAEGEPEEDGEDEGEGEGEAEGEPEGEPGCGCGKAKHGLQDARRYLGDLLLTGLGLVVLAAWGALRRVR